MTGLTKKHFEKIAEILARHEKDITEYKGNSVFMDIVRDFCQYLKGENPNFRETQFTNRIMELAKDKEFLGKIASQTEKTRYVAIVKITELKYDSDEENPSGYNQESHISRMENEDITALAQTFEDICVSYGEEGGSVHLLALTDQNNLVLPTFWLTHAKREPEINQDQEIIGERKQAMIDKNAYLREPRKPIMEIVKEGGEA